MLELFQERFDVEYSLDVNLKYGQGNDGIPVAQQMSTSISILTNYQFSIKTISNYGKWVSIDIEIFEETSLEIIWPHNFRKILVNFLKI